MAHEITVKKGKAEMAYVGEKPWHGLGQELKAGADINTWKKEAGMDWTIKSSPVLYGPGLKFDGYQALYRSDTDDALSIVSDNYKVVQPAEVLEFFRDLVGANGFELTTAGTLFGGKRFWALASIGKEACIVGKNRDKVGGYLLLSSSCDGTLATTARFTSVRVVCNNTLTMANKDKAEVVIRHRSDFDPAAVKNQLGVARDVFADFMKDMRSLAAVKLDRTTASDFVTQLLKDTKTVYKEEVEKTRQHQTIMSLYDGSGMGADVAGQTAWGLLNSVTEFVDHHARAKTDSARLASAWFGRGDDLKTLAAERLLELA